MMMLGCINVDLDFKVKLNWGGIIMEEHENHEEIQKVADLTISLVGGGNDFGKLGELGFYTKNCDYIKEELIRKFEEEYSYEEIETAFEKLCNEIKTKEIIVENNSELVDLLVGIMDYKKGKLRLLNLDWDKSNHIRQETLKKWQESCTSKDIKENFYTLCGIKSSEMMDKIIESNKILI